MKTSTNDLVTKMNKITLISAIIFCFIPVLGFSENYLENESINSSLEIAVIPEKKDSANPESLDDNKGEEKSFAEQIDNVMPNKNHTSEFNELEKDETVETELELNSNNSVTEDTNKDHKEASLVETVMSEFENPSAGEATKFLEQHFKNIDEKLGQ